MEQVEALLKHIGLTEYETKAYIALLKHGTLSADKISNQASIPLPRVYDTISELQKKGFVQVSMGRPKRFRAVNPKMAFSSFIEIKRKEGESFLSEVKTRADGIVKRLSSISAETSVDTEIKAEMWSGKSRRNITTLFNDFERIAKKEVLIFSGDLSWVNEGKEVLKSMIRKGVAIRAVVREPNGNKQIASNINKAKSIGISVRLGYNGNLRAQIIDGKIAAVINKFPKKENLDPNSGSPDNDTLFKYQFMSIETPSLVNALKENFEFWWKKLS